MTAAINSNIGSMNSLIGATRVLDMMRGDLPSWQTYATIAFLASIHEAVCDSHLSQDKVC